MNEKAAMLEYIKIGDFFLYILSDSKKDRPVRNTRMNESKLPVCKYLTIDQRMKPILNNTKSLSKLRRELLFSCELIRVLSVTIFKCTIILLKKSPLSIDVDCGIQESPSPPCSSSKVYESQCLDIKCAVRKRN